jgi:hypothetical protein
MAASSTGKVSAKQVFEADAGGIDEAVALTINQDVTLTDASGKPVTGELKVVIAAFTPSEPTAQASMPAELKVTTTGGEEAVSVVAAFITIDIGNAAGAQVSKLNPAAEVVVALDPQAKDPVTGESFKSGDKLSVWSNSDGVLKFEGTTTVSDEGTVTLSISHLTSYWVSRDVTTCGDNAPTLVLDGGEGADLDFDVESDQYTLVSTSAGQKTITLNSFPSTQPSLEIAVTLAGQSVGTKSAAGVKCGEAVLVPVTLPTKKGIVTVSVAEQCGSDAKSAKAVPSAPVFLYGTDGSLVSSAMTDAEGSISLVLPHGTYDYEVLGRTEGQSESKELVVDSDESVNVVFSLSCDDLTGAE